MEAARVPYYVALQQHKVNQPYKILWYETCMDYYRAEEAFQQFHPGSAGAPPAWIRNDLGMDSKSFAGGTPALPACNPWVPGPA
jgi:hypothetical protein